MHADYLVIGGGLSGLAAAIRLARYKENVLLLEKHTRVGGLNSYYYRNNRLFETGLHAITNYAGPTDKRAPLNRLLRQLKIDREEIGFHQQISSEIRFPGRQSLTFSNNFQMLLEEVTTKFQHDAGGFGALVEHLNAINPFAPAPFQSARNVLAGFLTDPLLVEMLLCPVLYYGSSWEDDIDLKQFVIMFRALFQEGMFRPAGTIKDLLDLLVGRLQSFGGAIRLGCGVEAIVCRQKKAVAVRLANGEEITCNYLVSTIGHEETRLLLGETLSAGSEPRLGFVETIFQLKSEAAATLPTDRTCIFFCLQPHLRYRQPQETVDLSSGVICLPFNFQGLKPQDDFLEVRTTHLANYALWKHLSADKAAYLDEKKTVARQSLSCAESLIGTFSGKLLYQDCFTPVTIERFTGKRQGAIYGSPDKIADGRIGYDNLILAGTDQGFLGIVGSMLSGVSMVNHHILPL